MREMQTANVIQQHDTSVRQTPQLALTEEVAAQARSTSSQRAAMNVPRLSPRNVLYLQRTVGNRAVAQLLGRKSTRSPQNSPPAIQAKSSIPTNLSVGQVVQREGEDDAETTHATPPTSASLGRIKSLLNKMLKVESGDTKTGGLDISKVRGKNYVERKSNILSTLETELKAESSKQEVREQMALLDTSPVLQSKIDILARGGSKVGKLTEGMEVQVLGKGPANFRRYLNLLQAKTGSDYVLDVNGTKIFREIEMAPLKGYARMGVKETEKYGGLVSKINDVVRCSLLFHTLDEILAADKALRAIPEDQHTIVQTKDRFGILGKGLFPAGGLSRQVKDDSEAEETNLNYRDIIYIVEVKGIVNRPINIEVQFHLETMHEAKSDKKLAASMFGKEGTAKNLIIPKSGLQETANDYDEKETETENGSSEKLVDRGSQDIVAKYGAEIGLTNSMAFYEQAGFTGHDLYKIIRYFDLKRFSPETETSDISMTDRITAQKASEDAKQMSRALYGSVWKSHMSHEPIH